MNMQRKKWLNLTFRFNLKFIVQPIYTHTYVYRYVYVCMHITMCLCISICMYVYYIHTQVIWHPIEENIHHKKKTSSTYGATAKACFLVLKE